MSYMKFTILEKIDNKISKDTNDCWNWTGSINQEGYGTICINGVTRQTRRIYYELNKKPLQKNECLLSICKNRSCINPNHMYLKNESLERFISKDEKTGCWNWTKGLSNGYGILNRCKKNQSRLVHRIIYEKYKGKIPEKTFVCHACDNTRCCNPDHLFLGNQLENMQDMHNKKRNNHAKGENAGKATLTNEQVKEIKLMLKNGLRPYQISKILNIKPHIICNINSQRSWRSVII